MVSVTIEEISENLSAYLQRVAAGESFVVLVEGKAIAEIKPTVQPSLADALMQLRQICQREDYSLEIPPRSDRDNPLVNHPT
jgi:antitoxin (DNA-binding transcriptional repressor) of toxin-antitoxin stability system